MHNTEEKEYRKVLNVPAGGRISRRSLRRATTGLERKTVRAGRKLAFWSNYLDTHPSVIAQAEANRQKLRPAELTNHDESDTVTQLPQETAD